VSSAYLEQPAHNDLCANRLLALLPEAERARIAPHLTSVGLAVGALLQGENAAIEYVYFPASGIVASTLVMPDQEVTAAITGNEGALFCDHSLSSLGSSLTRATVRSTGAAWRMPFQAWQELILGPKPRGLSLPTMPFASTRRSRTPPAACCTMSSRVFAAGSCTFTTGSGNWPSG